MSTGRPTRRSGTRCRYSPRPGASSSVYAAASSALTVSPGATQLKRTPRWLSSIANERITETIPALVAL